MLLKHMTGTSDREIVEAVLENPYMQMFCGYERFVTSRMLDAITLTRLRKKAQEHFLVVERLYDQQRCMYLEKSHRVDGPIVSLRRLYVRPVMRGKSGKDVEMRIGGRCFRRYCKLG